MPRKKKVVKGNLKKTRISQLSLDTSQMIKTQLKNLAHVDSEGVINILNKFFKEEDNEELREYAYIVRGDILYSYYRPKNKKERVELEIAFMINRRENYLMDLISEAGRLESVLRRSKIEKEIFKGLIKKQPEEKKKDWQYRYIDDMYVYDNNRLVDIKEDIEYETAWIKYAKSVITISRYKDMSKDVFDHLHLGDEFGCYWADGMLADDCCEINDLGCLFCCNQKNDEIAPIGNYKEGLDVDIPF